MCNPKPRDDDKQTKTKSWPTNNPKPRPSKKPNTRP